MSSTAWRAETGADYRFHRADLADGEAVAAAFAEGVAGGPLRPGDPSRRPGRRALLPWKTRSPMSQSNILGFTHMLEACRHNATPHLTFASTSSVYGANTSMPFAEGQGVDHPLQFYAATKRANELMAHSYAHLYRLPCTGLRFFTVYGPWGRPDMAPMLFASAIAEGRPIKVFNHGHHSRDFTYVDDIVEGVIRASDRIAEPDPGLGSGRPRPRHLERALPDLQYRQQRPGRARRFHRGARGGAGAQGDPGVPAAAARRRARHLRRQLAPRPRGELAPRHPGRRGGGALRGLVSGLQRPGPGAARHPIAKAALPEINFALAFDNRRATAAARRYLPSATDGREPRIRPRKQWRR